MSVGEMSAWSKLFNPHRILEARKRKTMVGHGRRRRWRRRRRPHRRRGRRRRRCQRGGYPAMAVAKGVYATLRGAADHAKTLKRDNVFRKVTVSRYGIPCAMERRMYHY
jgi:hypothetical protein